MSEVVDAYAFEDLPIEGAPAGTSVLVSGAALEGTRALTMRLVDPAEGEGAVLVTTDSNCERVIEEYREHATDWPRSMFAFVDCVGEGEDRSEETLAVRRISSPGDLTGIGMSYSALVDEMATSGVSRVRVGVLSFHTLLMYADLQTVYRFGHTMSGRIQATDGLGVFFIDPSTQEPQTVNTLAQFLDARIEVRGGDDGPELRCRGRIDGPGEWTAFDVP